jgi:hypothetical protein
MGLLAATLAVAGCASTQDKSAKLAKLAKTRLTAKGVVVTRPNPDVKVLSTELVQDSNGAAAVVTLKNTSSRPLAGLPVSILVSDKQGHRLFANDAPGLQPTLVTVPFIRRGGSFTWVNDQIPITAKAGQVKATIGIPTTTKLPAQPNLVIAGIKVTGDPISGVEAKGTITNKSSVIQRKIVLFGIARRGGRVVAGGRALVPQIKPGKTLHFSMYFIGDPRHGQLTIEAPPPIL